MILGLKYSGKNVSVRGRSRCESRMLTVVGAGWREAGTAVRYTLLFSCIFEITTPVPHCGQTWSSAWHQTGRLFYKGHHGGPMGWETVGRVEGK